MTIADRWLLPAGVEEIQPREARRMEEMRRQILDLFRTWGYELVITPLIEYTESLLIGLGHDLDTQTFKVTDQLTGRSMAIRPDITPQTARMDAHSLNREGPTRLCYADSVLHTRPRSLFASRSPFQVGAELYGDAGVASDIEVISLMLETLALTGLQDITLDLGHIGIYRELVAQAGLDGDQESQFFDALQRKAVTEIRSLLEPNGDSAGLLLQLTQLHGGIEVLDKARQVLAPAGDKVAAIINTLEKIADQISRRSPGVDLFFDLGELQGYRYHTGLVFGAYLPGCGQAIANGGRYDDIGEVFGRARPATGFNLDLKAVLDQLETGDEESVQGIFAPASDDESLWRKIRELRGQGYRVISGLGDRTSDSSCDQQLVLQDGEWQLLPLAVDSTPAE
jgi:ATP phosphoribosyltransferase regulatory subunit